jgi:NADH-quinone oxidoreductase subunit E
LKEEMLYNIAAKKLIVRYGRSKKKGEKPMSNALTRVSEIVDSYGCQQSNLIAILQDIQTEQNYLSEAALTLVAEKLGVSTSKVYSVATFYENFSLEAKGKHIIKVCAGTACHVRKSGPIYDAIRDYLNLTGKKKTSDDGMFTLETVACLGACGLAPVMTIDGEVHAKMTPDAALALLEQIRKEESAK